MKQNELVTVESKYKFDTRSLVSSTQSIHPLGGKPPVVRYTSLAWNKIKHLVKTCQKEVGWFGTVEKNGNMYLITDIFVPKQTVTGAETDILPEDLADIVELVEDPEQLYYWGHSHVSMGVGPSGQDEDQTSEYLEHLDVFIRGIYNKRGESKVDVYDTAVMLCHQCVDNKPLPSLLSEEEEKALDEVIKEKVISRTYSTPKSTYSYPRTTTQPTNFKPRQPATVSALTRRQEKKEKKKRQRLAELGNHFIKRLL